MAPRGPTTKDVVEFTRIVAPRNGDLDQLRSQTSPDGTRAFIVTRKANTRTDRNRYEILLLDVRPETLVRGQVSSPVAVAAIEPALDNDSAYPSLQDAQWVGDRTIVFRARIFDAVFQAFKVDTESRVLTQLTFSPTDVVSFAVTDDLRTVVYTAQENNPPLRGGARSVVVGNQSFWSVKFGQQDMRSQQRRYQHFAVEAGSREPPRRLGPVFSEGASMKPSVRISPDGRWALLPRYEPARIEAWSKDYPLVADAAARSSPAVTMDRWGYFTRATDYVPKRVAAYRLADGSERTVVDAPDDSTSDDRINAVWQKGGESVLIAGTHLPKGTDTPTSGASHIIEYWPQTGRWEVVAALKGRLHTLLQLSAPGDAFQVTDAGGRRTFQRKAGGGWLEAEIPAAAAPRTGDRAAGTGAWSLRIREDLNVPPDIVAVGPAGQSVALTRLNPQVSSAWGAIRPYNWKDAKGRRWDGGLLVPDGFTPGAPHALVIQTYGFSPNRFYLDGANTSDGFTSGFAGRAFLKENILVLALPSRASTDAPRTEAGGIESFMDGVRGAIEALAAEGLVDREKVGIMGWSMTGERVLNQVTFSDAPVRAATILDGDANTLFSMAVTYGASEGTQARKEKTNQALPFGDSLGTWVRNDPSLHTDCVTAALRIETYGPWVLNNWDIYALLRRQHKAAEMVVIPGGSHGLMTPSERMVSLQGNVDWYRFWLKGEERTEPFLWAESDETLKDQYRRWHQMVELKRIDDAKPVCARKAKRP